jgi:hypothetical protein
MIVTKTVIGLMLIVLSLSMLYVIGRITIPILDPEWNRFGTPHYIIVMLAGVIALAVLGLIVMMCVMGYAVGEAAWQAIQ